MNERISRMERDLDEMTSKNQEASERCRELDCEIEEHESCLEEAEERREGLQVHVFLL